MGTASQGSGFDFVLRRTENQFRKCPDTRRKFTRAVQAVALDVAHAATPPRGGRGLIRALLAFFGIVSLAIVIMACAGCATLEPETVQAVRDGLSHNLVTAEDVAAVTTDARAEAAVNADLLAVILRDATGEDLPPEVQARLDAHRELMGGR